MCIIKWHKQLYPKSNGCYFQSPNENADVLIITMSNKVISTYNSFTSNSQFPLIQQGNVSLSACNSHSMIILTFGQT